MKTIRRRLLKLENMLAPQPIEEDAWGSMVGFRNELLRRADRAGEAHAASIRQELDDLGPHGLWLEMVRSFLARHEIVQSSDESFAETIARALGIDTEDLHASIAQGRLGCALLERFP
jgi:hypothetical protein